MKHQSGFTLIEVLIALAITAIAAIISYSGLDSAMKLAESSELEADRLQKMNRVFDILSKDFRQIVPRKVRSPSGDEFEHALYFEDMAYPYLRFSRNGWTNPQPERFQRSQLQRVNYNLDDGKLTRSSWQAMDRYEDSEAQEIVLLKDVKTFEIRALTTDDQPSGGKIDFGKTVWVDSWPKSQAIITSATTALPLAIEVLIEIDGWGKVRRVFELVDNEGL